MCIVVMDAVCHHGGNQCGLAFFEALSVDAGPTLPGRNMLTTAEERFLGCLLGAAVGDALGAPVEFLSLVDIRGRFGQAGIRDYHPAYGKVGAITDDTQMSLF